MNYIEKKLRELHAYAPDVTAPDDLDTFWQQTLADSASRPLRGERERLQTPMRGIDAWSIAYNGCDDETPVAGVFIVPSYLQQSSYPCIIHFHGYSGSAGLPERFAPWLLAGFAVFAIDIRGQTGGTGDHIPQQGGMTKGWITKGITDKDTCYYKAIVLDSLRAIDWAAAQPEVDAHRVGVVGGSQGGGLAMIAAALHRNVRFAVADIPNMCHMDWGIFHSTGSLTEAAGYVSKFPEQLHTVLHTLSYFDNMNLAARIQCPILVSVSLKDTVCMPETVFAAYNLIRAEKQLEVYPFMGHTTGDKHLRLVLQFAIRHAGLEL